MSKKVVLFTTYLLEEQSNYLFDNRSKRFGLDFFQSADMLDFLLDDPLTLKSCSDYFAMMEWKKVLKDEELWDEKFESPFMGDEFDQISNYLENIETFPDQLMEYIENLERDLNLSAALIDKNIIKQNISSIANDVAKQECQRFANDVLNMYWGNKDTPKLPLLHRRFSLYLLKNEKCPDYATYAVWSLRDDKNNDKKYNRWRDALIREVLERNQDDCEEIILAIHDRDAGQHVPFEKREYKNEYKYKGKTVSYSVVLFDHANSRIHPLLRQSLSCSSVYEKISELIKSY